MKEIILKQLSEQNPGARKDGLELIANILAMAATDEENAKKLAETYTGDKVKDFISNYRKSADAEITKALKTAEENRKEKDKQPEPMKPKPEENPSEKIAEMIAKAIEPYKQKLDEFEAGNIKAKRREKFADAIKGAPESIRDIMADGFESKNFADDAEFDAYLENAKNKAVNIEKELNSAGLRALGAPSRGSQNPDGVSAGAKAYVERMKAKK